MLKLVVNQIVVTTLTDRFFFFLQFTVMCWDKTKVFMVRSEPPECIRYIAIYVLSCRTIAIYDMPIKGLFTYYGSRQRGGRGYGKC